MLTIAFNLITLYPKNIAMKKLSYLSFVLWILCFSNVTGKNLKARFAYATFFSPEKGPYVETYLDVNGSSVYFMPVKEGFQASIEISLVYKRNDSIVYFDKYNLLSPTSKDTQQTVFDFTDQQRVVLPNGTYTFELTIKDKNNSIAKPYFLTQEITLSYYPNLIAISDIELLSFYKASDVESKVNKNGYEILPLVDNFFDVSNNSFKFYGEIYNTSSIFKSDPFLLSYHIETNEQKKILDNFSKVSRPTSKPVTILLGEFDITSLPSGNYNFVVQVRNRKNELLAIKETFFQRSNPIPVLSDSVQVDYRNIDVKNTFVSRYSSKDEMFENVRCLYPIAGLNENQFIFNQAEFSDLNLMQQFFYNFWVKRNPLNPEQAWTEYKSEVDKVNKEYSAGSKKGYLTERGRVYLCYGAPNQISKMYNEPASYPYEIWQYYKIKNQTNRKFVFYSEQLATNDFDLLHSDYRGEINNPNWQVELRSRTELMNDLDKQNPNNNFQNQSRQMFENPR
jgi:GWxTD domain-containing protein